MSRITINSNISSLNTQRSLFNATKKVQDIYTRLSSGLRVNKASDDAAGLAISENLKADTRIQNQGIKNLNDGVSLLNIADGALNELSNIMIRLNELAEQASNGTLANKQRLALDQEAQSLSKEYNRIARTTEFNGRKIFDGDFGDLSLAAGGGSNTLVVDDLGGVIGDGTFAAAVSYLGNALGDRLSNVSDVNNDGYDDVISTNYTLSTISIYINNGNGTFKARTTYATSGNNMFDVQSGDFNNDGNIDLVTANQSNGTIGVLIGNGNGTFRSSVSYAAGAGTYSVDVGDVNNDGILDVISSNFSASSISVFIANSDGSFNASYSYSTLSGPYTAKLYDFNNDGILDLVNNGSVSSLVQVRLGNGNGTFKVANNYNTGATVNGATSLEIGDINNDGQADMMFANSSDKSISYVFGNGDGTFSSARVIAEGPGFNDPYTTIFGDINGDGNLDLISSNIASSTISTRLGNGDGTFKARNSISMSTGGGIAIGDFNRDGVTDIAATYVSMNILLGNSNSGVSALQQFSLRSKTDSREALDYFRDALNRLSQQRGHIGAFQSRVETATSNLFQSKMAYQEASSRITDVDVAEESSKLVAAQIIQQAAVSILAQANQQPSITLLLLRSS